MVAVALLSVQTEAWDSSASGVAMGYRCVAGQLGAGNVPVKLPARTGQAANSDGNMSEPNRPLSSSPDSTSRSSRRNASASSCSRLVRNKCWQVAWLLSRSARASLSTAA